MSQRELCTVEVELSGVSVMLFDVRMNTYHEKIASRCGHGHVSAELQLLEYLVLVEVQTSWDG